MRGTVRARWALGFGVGSLVALAPFGALRAGQDDYTPHATQPIIAYPMIDPTGTAGLTAVEVPLTDGEELPEGELPCLLCHSAYDARHLEPYDTWAGSMMANAARDPVFWAALDVANHDLPGIGEYCLRCHAPKAWLEGRASAALPDVGDADGCALAGALDDGAVDADFQGVSCHFCHRMMVNESPPPGEQGVYLENGQYWIDDVDCPDDGYDEPCRRGPYGGYSGNEPPHSWRQSPYHTAADLCGNCHNVTNPVKTLIDENGADTGIPYPIERTFKEWQQSDFAPGGGRSATCQNCHMPDAAGPDARACAFGSSPDRSGDLPIHDFVGGNAWIPAVLRDYYGDAPGQLGVERQASFDATVALAVAMLESAAELTVWAPLEIAPGAPLTLDLRVTNQSGHKLPTGYPEGRRMWLNVAVRDADGELVFESGAYDAATAELDRDPQIKVYETIRGVWNGAACEHTESGREVFHFVLNDCIALDNRVPPAGFAGAADPETAPVGYAYPETAPGSGVLVHWDDTRYEILIPDGTPSPLSISAALRYQTSSKEYIEFLRDEAVTHDFADDCLPRLGGPIGASRGEHLYDLWDSVGVAEGYARSAPIAMATYNGSVAIDGDIFVDGFETGDTEAWSQTVP